MPLGTSLLEAAHENEVDLEGVGARSQTCYSSYHINIKHTSAGLLTHRGHSLHIAHDLYTTYMYQMFFGIFFIN